MRMQIRLFMALFFSGRCVANQRDLVPNLTRVRVALPHAKEMRSKRYRNPAGTDRTGSKRTNSLPNRTTDLLRDPGHVPSTAYRKGFASSATPLGTSRSAGSKCGSLIRCIHSLAETVANPQRWPVGTGKLLDRGSSQPSKSP